ncbi:MAG: hypothetical protein ACNA8R_12930 [Nitriliruptoraceae bacterium]
MRDLSHPEPAPTVATGASATAALEGGAPGPVLRVRTALLGLWAAITGAAPHVLHHVGPLAGTALVAGAGGRVLFGVAGFVATIPMLRRLRRRTGSWRVPGLALAAFAVIYTVSTLLVGPAIGAATSPEATTTPTVEVEVDHHGHDVSED